MQIVHCPNDAIIGPVSTEQKKSQNVIFIQIRSSAFHVNHLTLDANRCFGHLTYALFYDDIHHFVAQQFELSFL